MVASTSGELTIDCTQPGAFANVAGNIATRRKVNTPAPITMVRRASSTREETICTPLIMMKAAANKQTRGHNRRRHYGQ